MTFIGLILLACHSVQASETEMATLERLHHSLVGTRFLIEKAQNQSIIDTRYSVDYKLLLAEYDALINGVKDIIDLQIREPRMLHDESANPHISGRYLP